MSAKVEGDESCYYELEAALEQEWKEVDEKEKEEATEQEERNEEAEGSHLK